MDVFQCMCTEVNVTGHMHSIQALVGLTKTLDETVHKSISGVQL